MGSELTHDLLSMMHGLYSKSDWMVVKRCDWSAGFTWCFDDGCGCCYEWETGTYLLLHYYINSNDTSTIIIANGP